LAELNPIAAWNRFLAAPSDGRAKTITVAFIVSAICALLVTVATVYLRPIQAANRAAEEQVRLEALLSAIPGMREVMAEAGDGALSTVVVNLDTGTAAEDVTPAALEGALENPNNWTPLLPERDGAGIGNRPDLAQIFLLREGDTVSLVILPVFGAGYNGPIRALLALRGDTSSIAGLTVTEQSETPGLGARIEEAAWQQGFAGKRVTDESGAVRFSVARGPSGSEFEVDGITGATRTGNAITRIVRFWVGEDGYGNLLRAIRRGEF
jgi:Na+-transporting NADH:ubiquinone oxidoreductase subunit C